MRTFLGVMLVGVALACDSPTPEAQGVEAVRVDFGSLPTWEARIVVTIGDAPEVGHDFIDPRG